MPPQVKTRNLWDFLEAFPPPYCRILAKQPGGGMGDLSITDAEIAIESGIPLSRVREISQQPSWDSVTQDEMRRFFSACKFDPTKCADRMRVYRYNKICEKRKTPPFHYLRRSPKWETEFLPLWLLVRKIMQSQGVSLPATRASVIHARS